MYLRYTGHRRRAHVALTVNKDTQDNIDKNKFSQQINYIQLLLTYFRIILFYTERL